MAVVLPYVMLRPGFAFVVELRPAGMGMGEGTAWTAAMTATTTAAEKILLNIMSEGRVHEALVQFWLKGEDNLDNLR